MLSGDWWERHASGEDDRRECRDGGSKIVGPTNMRGAAALASRHEEGRGAAVHGGRWPVGGQERRAVALTTRNMTFYDEFLMTSELFVISTFYFMTISMRWGRLVTKKMCSPLMPTRDRHKVFQWDIMTNINLS
jgi:hypothetical protein